MGYSAIAATTFLLAITSIPTSFTLDPSSAYTVIQTYLLPLNLSQVVEQNA